MSDQSKPVAAEIRDSLTDMSNRAYDLAWEAPASELFGCQIDLLHMAAERIRERMVEDGRIGESSDAPPAAVCEGKELPDGPGRRIDCHCGVCGGNLEATKLPITVIGGSARCVECGRTWLIQSGEYRRLKADALPAPAGELETGVRWAEEKLKSEYQVPEELRHRINVAKARQILADAWLKADALPAPAGELERLRAELAKAIDDNRALVRVLQQANLLFARGASFVPGHMRTESDGQPAITLHNCEIEEYYRMEKAVREMMARQHPSDYPHSTLP